MVDEDDAMAKARLESLKEFRDQAAADAERIQLALNTSALIAQGVCPQGPRTDTARNGGYRRDHLRTLAQRVEVLTMKFASRDRSRN
ncbi:hypothetical protein [Pseudoxanthobacter soli]|uniref:hypothetical protein n=1 Tax=Pseudoxanthobacter soli TaxID=433840 RepID=UPI000935B849|nr:hypothetical protein [Pseudoxanthobacter soli]